MIFIAGTKPRDLEPGDWFVSLTRKYIVIAHQTSDDSWWKLSIYGDRSWPFIRACKQWRDGEDSYAHVSVKNWPKGRLYAEGQYPRIKVVRAGRA